MTDYRVNFYKTLLNSQGHSFKCLQQGVDVKSNSPASALLLAQAKIGPTLDPGCIEVVHTHTSGFHETLDEGRQPRV